MAPWSTYLQWTAYVLLLFFVVPIKIHGPDESEEQFKDYLIKFNKSYVDPELYQTRLQAFQKSLETIGLLNGNRTGNHSAIYGLTKFSDMSPDEFESQHLNANLSERLMHKKKKPQRHKRSLKDLPRKLDWRAKKAVTKIKNQGSCGACWAFSGIETVESVSAIKTGKLQELSVQQMIDCAGYTNQGCSGGDICTLVSWMKDTGVNVMREDEYPLSLKNGHCKAMNATAHQGVVIDDYICENFVDSEEVLLELLLKTGPMAVAINAKTWQNYVGGVIQYHCDGDPSYLNHAVQIVGYDLEAAIPHYIARNTWGEDFGDKGYLYLAIGKNICGMAQEVTGLSVR